MARIVFENIKKVYPGDVLAVQDFNLSVEDEEFLVLVGPSGCGKSTVLRIAAGLEEASSGQLWINGQLANRMPPKERDIAMVFQNYALYPHMTVYQNMALALELRKLGRREIRKRIHEVAKTLDIEYLLNRKPRVLSGGQRQRAALGRAMIREPAVFLLDEPLSNLDARLRVQMRAELLQLHQRMQTPFVYVTHDQTEAMSMGDRIVVMRDGFIQQADTPQNLYRFPINQFVAGFIGTPPMNFVETVLYQRMGAFFIRAFGAEIPVLAKKDTKGALPRCCGMPVTAGLRPEAFSCTPIADGLKIEANVELIEHLGNECLVHWECQNTRFIARVMGRLPTGIEGRCPVWLDPGALYLFSAADGLAICH